MEALGINITSIFIYSILFGVVYVILNKYLTGPLIDIIEKRKSDAAEGARIKKQIQNELDSIATVGDNKLNEAKLEAKSIKDSVRESGKNIAAKLFLDNQKGQDFGLVILNTIVDTRDADMSHVINNYEDIILGKKMIAQVITSSEISDIQAKKIKIHVERLFKDRDLLFVFTIDESVVGCIEVLVGDDKVSFKL